MNLNTIRGVMARRFWDHWNGIYARKGALPSDDELCARQADWLTPYLTIFDLDSARSVRFAALGDGWRDWWSLDGSMDTLKANASEERLDLYWQAVMKAAAHPCGLLEDSVHQFPTDTRQQKIDSLALPLQPSRNAKVTVAVFAIITTMSAGTSMMNRQWLDIGSGIPEQPAPT